MKTLRAIAENIRDLIHEAFFGADPRDAFSARLALLMLMAVALGAAIVFTAILASFTR